MRNGFRALRITIIIAGIYASHAHAFCEDDPKSMCHAQMITSGLPFLRDHILRALVHDVLAPDRSGALNFETYEHFDNCFFTGSIKNITKRYNAAISSLSPLKKYPDIFGALYDWGYVLHAAEDFYAHSNWINMGFIDPKTELFDTGLGNWEPIGDKQNLKSQDILTAQSPFSSTWRVIYPTDTSLVPHVKDPNGKKYRLLTSGRPKHHHGCIKYGGFAHFTLNKDDYKREGYKEASAMALAQTRHEWCRLLNLALRQENHGKDAAAFIMGLMVKPGSNPHPDGTACAQLAPGSIEMTIKPTTIRILRDHEDDTAGQINLVLTAFTTNFGRSVRSQTPETRIESGHTVAHMPALLKLCVSPADRLIVTLQGWENDNDILNTNAIPYGPYPVPLQIKGRNDLNAADDLLSGATAKFGRSDALVGHTESIRVQSLRSKDQDLDMTFEVSGRKGGSCPG